MSDDSGNVFDVLWRSYRLKWTILLFLLFGFLAVRATLNRGLEAMKEVDRKSVEARTAWFAETHTTPADSQPLLPETSLIADQTELALDSYLIPILSTAQSPPTAKDAIAKFQRRAAELADLMDRREKCFDFLVEIPGTKVSTPVNALWLIEIWPFAVVFLTAFLICLDLRQRTCEIIQSHGNAKCGPDAQRMVLAKSGFLIGVLREVKDGNQPYFQYRSNPILVPERLLTLCLWLLFFYACFRLFPAVAIPDPFSASSTLWGVHTALIASLLLSVIGVWHTKRFYDAQLAQELELPLRRVTYFSTGKIWRLLLSPYVYVLAVVIAFVAFVLPWDQPWHVSGLRFLWKQVPIIESGGMAVFAMPPAIFRECQVQVFIALILITLSVANRITRRRHIWLAKTSRVLSLVNLGLVVNTLAFWLMLDYRAEREVVGGLMGMVFQNDFTGPRGMPMVMHEPGIGVIMFMSALVLLCIIELRAGTAERSKPTHIVQVAHV